MGSDMGNNNVSGIKEEQATVVVAAEKALEAVASDEVKGENHSIFEDQTKGSHAKGDELPSNSLSAVNDLDTERDESNGKALIPKTGAEKSRHHSQSQEVSPESNNSNGQESDTQEFDSPDEINYEKPTESNLEENLLSNDLLQIHDQPSIEKETETKEAERTDSSDSEITTQPSNSSNQSTIALEDSQCSLSSHSEEVPSMNCACNLEEKGNAQAQEGIKRDENQEDLVSEETPIIESELQEANTSTEKCCSNSTDNKFGRAVLEYTSVAQVPLIRNLNEFSDSSTEVALQYSSLDTSVATPEPQQKCIIHAEEIDLISIKSEEVVNKQEPNDINSPEQTVNDLIINNSASSVNLHEASSKENGEENEVQMKSNSDLEKVYINGEVKVTHKRTKSVMAGNKRCASTDQFEYIEEDIKMLPSITSVSTQLSSTDKHDEEEKATGKTISEEAETRDVSSSMEMNNDGRGISEESILSSESFKWESSLLETSSASELNYQRGNATLFGSEAAEDRQNCTKIEMQDFYVNSTSTHDAHKETTQITVSSSALESFKPETANNIQKDSGTSAETEILSNLSNQQCPTGDYLPNGKAQESSTRLSIESNPGHHGNQVQRSKSPSFDFGLQLDAKSEDSDQTPLLHHDKTAARSFSGFANVRFQNRIIQTDYGRNSLDFEPVAVEEKTIRMERSDSDISRASFMNLLKKDDRGNNTQFSPKNQESPVASNNSDDLSTEELALTSVKGSGKRKSRPSIFTSCICCTASIH